MAITKDFVVDYAADPTGVADTKVKLQLFQVDMAGVDATLNVPVGNYKQSSAAGGGIWATGMTSLVVNATGAYFFEAPGGGPTLGSLHFSQIGIAEATGKSARIQTVSPGATSVTLTPTSAAAGYISRAVVGRYMCVAGFDIQGLFLSAFGFPQNNHFLDYVQITAVDTVNKIISFTPALSNFYSDQWPCFNPGSSGEVDAGGPATVYFLHPDFGHTTVINGLSLNSSNNIKCEGLDFTINGGSYPAGGLPVYPTANKIWRAINHDTSGAGQMELDKMVDTAIFDGGASHQFQVQSSSLKNLFIRNTTMDGAIAGSGCNTTVENCSIGTGITIGPTSYGRGETFVCRNTSIAGTIGGGYTLSGPSSEGFQAFATMANGVITIPITFDGNSVMRAFVPDSYGRNVLFWTGSIGSIGGFQIRSVTSDPWPAVDIQSSTTNVTMANASKTLQVSSSIFASGDVGKVILVPGARGAGLTLKTFITGFTSATQVTVYDACSNPSGLSASSQTVQWGTSNVYIQTNQSGGFPSGSLYTTLGVRVPPARTVYFESCTGIDHAIDLCQAGAQNKPLWSYSKRTYDGVTGVSSGSGPAITMHGMITAIRINVLTAYTGAGTLSVGLSAADNLPVIVNGVATTLIPRVNLKVVGERVMTVGSTTGAWAGTNPDTNMTLSANTWIGRTFSAGMSRDISGDAVGLRPSFTIEMITDQGFYTGPTAVAPLRMRLRA